MSPSPIRPTSAITLLPILLLACSGEARIELLPSAPQEPGDDMVEAAGAAAPTMALPDPLEGELGDAPDQLEVTLDEPLQDEPGRVASDEPERTDVASASALLLRYDFEGTGDMVMDRVGDAHGHILGGAALDGHGQLVLDGVDDYVDMPNGILSGLEDVTISAWLSWRGGPCWQRVFDFGSTDAGEDNVGNATTSLFLTPASCPAGVMTFMTERTSDKQTLLAAAPMPNDRVTHVTLVLSSRDARVSLYVDGRLAARDTNAHAMHDLQDVNNWLGRSQWIQDGYLRARFDELRIYGAALDADEVAALHERGPGEL